jgi:MarR family transcriptional regulator, transcriptional regulator for hemolysin
MSADPDGDELVNLLTDVARQMRARGDQLTVRGMSSAQLTILTFIERQPGLSQNELAAHAELAPITVGHHVLVTTFARPRRASA